MPLEEGSPSRERASAWEQEYWRSAQLREEGRLDEAISELRRLRLSAHDDEEKGLCALGEALCLVRPGRTEEGRVLLRQAERLLPALPEYELRVGLAKGSLDEAEERFDEALDKVSNLGRRFKKLLKSPDLRDLYEYVQAKRGMLMVRLRRYRQARPILEEALGFEGERRPEFLCQLGVCYVFLKEYERARNALVLALEKKTEGPWADTSHHYLGLAHIGLGAYALAIQELEKSVSLARVLGRPVRATHRALAVAWRQLGREDLAAHYEALSRKG